MDSLFTKPFFRVSLILRYIFLVPYISLGCYFETFWVGSAGPLWCIWYSRSTAHKPTEPCSAFCTVRARVYTYARACVPLNVRGCVWVCAHMHVCAYPWINPDKVFLPMVVVSHYVMTQPHRHTATGASNTFFTLGRDSGWSMPNQESENTPTTVWVTVILKQYNLL